MLAFLLLCLSLGARAMPPLPRLVMEMPPPPPPAAVDSPLLRSVDEASLPSSEIPLPPALRQAAAVAFGESPPKEAMLLLRNGFLPAPILVQLHSAHPDGLPEEVIDWAYDISDWFRTEHLNEPHPDEYEDYHYEYPDAPPPMPSADEEEEEVESPADLPPPMPSLAKSQGFGPSLDILPLAGEKAPPPPPMPDFPEEEEDGELEDEGLPSFEEFVRELGAAAEDGARKVETPVAEMASTTTAEEVASTPAPEPTSPLITATESTVSTTPVQQELANN